MNVLAYKFLSASDFFPLGYIPRKTIASQKMWAICKTEATHGLAVLGCQVLPAAPGLQGRVVWELSEGP